MDNKWEVSNTRTLMSLDGVGMEFPVDPVQCYLVLLILCIQS